ncbi:cilia- and flagella-associated protein 276 isoform X2 [Salminus brasiliensis]|uniref:cilia- and flagella-associated protein 276 isoform X2 n=1 Tax=Salminus brasiliensis TaxID=930266 RepID=UPI003B82D3F2
MPGHRDPFSFPRYENDLTFSGIQESQKLPYKKPTHIAQNDEPWSRLNDTATSSSMRRSVLHRDEAPKDSLDFHLSSVYDNHLDFLQNKNQTLLQRETLTDRRGTHKDSDEPNRDPLRVWVNPQKASIFSIEGTIESHHNASTNRGYSRKHDGGFYSA